MLTAASQAVNDLASISIGQWSAGGFVALIILMLLTGRLATGKERDYWRDMALELLDQNGKLLNGAETTNRVLDSLPVAEESKDR